MAIDPEGGTLLEYTYTETINVEEGTAFDPFWSEDPEEFFGYQGPRVPTVTIDEVARVLGQGAIAGANPFVPGGAGRAGAGAIKAPKRENNLPGVPMGQSRFMSSPLTMGKGTESIEVTDHQRSRTFHLGKIRGVLGALEPPT